MNDIKLINLSSYVRPDVVELKTRGYVMNGRDNSFYQYIIDRNNGSATNNSINQSYSTLIYGKGLTTDSGRHGAETWAKLQTIIRPTELRKMVTDFQVFGEFSFQVIENRGGELDSIVHLPKQMVIPSLVNENNEIDSYYFSKDWSNIRKQGNEPIQFPAFKVGRGNSIFVAKPYRVGCEYFGSPDYVAGLQYMEAEEEISNLTISSIKNGLSGGYIINIPDGINYTAEEKIEFERQVKKKLTQSSNASNFIISFNGSEVAIDITPFPVNDNIHKQWNFLTEEAKKQIMTSHRVISPSLVGLDSATGFSSQADMIDESEKQLMKRVILPKQNFILETLEEVLTQYDMNISLLFKPLTQELEVSREESQELSAQDVNFTKVEFETYNDYPKSATTAAKRALAWADENGWGSCGTPVGKTRANQLANRENISEDTIARMASFARHAKNKDVPYSEGCGGLMWDAWGGTAGIEWASNKLKEIRMSSEVCCSAVHDDESEAEMISMINKLALDPPSEYELTDGTEYDSIQLSANQSSEQDTKLWKTRYAFTVGTSKNPKGGSRTFCVEMLAKTAAGKVFRKEDIDLMSSQGINGKFAKKGESKYDIFKYGGGVNCHHRFERRVYKKKLNKDGTPKKGGAMASTVEKNVNQAIREGYKAPKNHRDVAIAEIDKPNKGRVN